MKDQRSKARPRPHAARPRPRTWTSRPRSKILALRPRPDIPVGNLELINYTSSCFICQHDCCGLPVLHCWLSHGQKLHWRHVPSLWLHPLSGMLYHQMFYSPTLCQCFSIKCKLTILLLHTCSINYTSPPLYLWLSQRFTSYTVITVCYGLCSLSFPTSASLCWQQWHDCTTYLDCALWSAQFPPHLKNINVSCEQFKSGVKTALYASLLIRGASENFV